MKDNQLCIMAMFIAVVYFIYMYIGPGGDGIIFASVVGAICALAGIRYERTKGQLRSPSEQEDTEYPEP